MTPLHDIVDPDALEQLFAPTGVPNQTEGDRIELEYVGCEVTVFRDGQIVIRPPPEPTTL